MTEIVLSTILLCGINLLSFVIGAKLGMNIKKEKPISINPIANMKENKIEKEEKKKAELSDRQLQTMLNNIDKYDGSSLGQQDIPRE